MEMSSLKSPRTPRETPYLKNDTRGVAVIIDPFVMSPNVKDV